MTSDEKLVVGESAVRVRVWLNDSVPVMVFVTKSTESVDVMLLDPSCPDTEVDNDLSSVSDRVAVKVLVALDASLTLPLRSRLAVIVIDVNRIVSVCSAVVELVTVVFPIE